MLILFAEFANLLFKLLQLLCSGLGLQSRIHKAPVNLDEPGAETTRHIAGVEQDVRIEGAHISIDDLEVRRGNVMHRLVVLRVQATNPHLEQAVAEDHRLFGQEGWQFDGTVALLDLEDMLRRALQDVLQNRTRRLHERRGDVTYRLRNFRGASAQQTQFLGDNRLSHLGVRLRHQVDTVALAHFLPQIQARLDLVVEPLGLFQVVQAVFVEDDSLLLRQPVVVMKRHVDQGGRTHAGAVELEADHHARGNLDQIDGLQVLGELKPVVPHGHPLWLAVVDDVVGHLLQLGNRSTASCRDGQRDVKRVRVEAHPKQTWVAEQGAEALHARINPTPKRHNLLIGETLRFEQVVRRQDFTVEHYDICHLSFLTSSQSWMVWAAFLMSMSPPLSRSRIR